MFLYKKKNQKRESNVLAGRTKRSFNADANTARGQENISGYVDSG
jgi:hypothetical protein